MHAVLYPLVFPGHDRAEIEAILHGRVHRAGIREAYVSMTCTRGPYTGVDADRTAVGAFGLSVVTCGEKDRAEHVVRVGVLRIEADRFPERGSRLRVSS